MTITMDSSGAAELTNATGGINILGSGADAAFTYGLATYGVFATGTGASTMIFASSAYSASTDIAAPAAIGSAELGTASATFTLGSTAYTLSMTYDTDKALIRYDQVDAVQDLALFIVSEMHVL